MSVLGTGIDIVETARIRTLIEKHGSRFLERVFTASERAYCGALKDPAPCFAARFAAKEAISKALGTGIGEHLGWLDVQIDRSPEGKPTAELSGQGAVTVSRLGGSQLLITMSHSEHYAVAHALLLS